MNKQVLGDAFQKHRIRRGYPHRYEQLYRDINERRGAPKSIFEIGVGAGHCLLAWRDAYPNALIMGLEKDKRLVEMSINNQFRITQYDATKDGVSVEVGEVWDLMVDGTDAPIEDRIQIFHNLVMNTRTYVVETLEKEEVPLLRTAMKQHGLTDVITYTSAAHRNQPLTPWYSLVLYNDKT